MNETVKYPAKILLFGEHILMQGAKALAAPLRRFGGYWEFAHDDVPLRQMRLSEWADYLEPLETTVRLDIAAFRRELSEGLYFQSDIPTGYGLGSSGALCAAVYDRYALDKIDFADTLQWTHLKSILAAMEGFFHGASSGVDPLISCLARPVLLQPDGQILPAVLPRLEGSEFRLFLLDSRISRQTEPLVSYFRNCCADSNFFHEMQSRLVRGSDAAIIAWMEGRMIDFQRAFMEVSRFQLEQLSAMIPDEIQVLWRQGFQERSFMLKFCGAGGGGMFLGMALDWERAQNTLASRLLMELDI